jgi:hypothetical protein
MEKKPIFENEQEINEDWRKYLIEEFGRKEIESPYFGHLKYDFSGRNMMSWKGSVYFNPTQEPIEICVRRNRNETPTEKDWEFFKEIEENYLELMRIIAEEDLFPYMKSIQKDFNRDDIWRVFSLVAITVPKNEGDNRHWNLDYKSSLDSRHYSILMVNWKKRGLWVDYFPKTQVF